MDDVLVCLVGFVLFFAGCFLEFYFETEEYAELCSISEREEKRRERERREREREEDGAV